MFWQILYLSSGVFGTITERNWVVRTLCGLSVCAAVPFIWMKFRGLENEPSHVAESHFFR